MTNLLAVHNTCPKIYMLLGHLGENVAAGELHLPSGALDPMFAE